MKIVLIISLLISCISSSAQTTPAMEFVEINYGTVKANREKTEKLSTSPTGDRGYLADFVFIKYTDCVPAVIKNNFGVEYMIKTTNDE
jgi:hypothetical protein